MSCGDKREAALSRSSYCVRCGHHVVTLSSPSKTTASRYNGRTRVNTRKCQPNSDLVTVSAAATTLLRYRLPPRQLLLAITAEQGLTRASVNLTVI